jgi:hypothetical protein
MSGNTGLVAPGVIIGKPESPITTVVLSSGVGQAFDVPAGKNIASFSLSGDFWVAYGSTTAAVPTTSSTGGAVELNPTIRFLGSTVSCTGISIISEVAPKGSITWYSK